MIKKLLFAALPLAGLIILSSGQMSDNGKAGRTGSPGESNCVSCHNSYTLNAGGGSIYLNSPGTPSFQYTPGQTYNMSITVKRLSNPLFGIGIEALTTGNLNAGTLNITDAAATQIKSATVSGVSRRNIVHTLDGGQHNDSMVFNFSWTSPTTGTGNVTFYFAGVAANGTGDENGDYVYISTQVFTEGSCSLPPQPGIISGNTTLCSGVNTSYSITDVAGATSYTWTLPSGWTGASTTNIINVTSSNTSGVISVKANNSCGASPASTLSVSANNLSLNTSSSHITCFGNANGTASVTPSGGVGPYTYVWSPSGSTTSSLNNLTPGTYIVTVSEGSGCSRTASVTITEPVVLSVSVSSTNAACASGSGTAAATPSGGTSPYTYSWSPSGGSVSSANLPAGNYIVLVTDARGCTKSSAVTITQPAPIAIGMSSTNAKCNLGSGTTTASPTGGTSPYNYLWSPSGGTTSSATLSAGSYTVRVTDSHGCSSTSSVVTITQPTAISIAISTTDASCSSANGTTTAIPTGGTGSYSYVWTTIPVQTTSIANNLAAGNYTVTVTDANGCTKTSTTLVNQPSSLTATSSVTPVNCHGGSNGQASVNVSGGTPGYSYSWSTIPIQTTSIATNLSAGSFTAIVTDMTGCSFSETVTVIEPAQLVTSAGNGIDLCEGNSTIIGGAPTASGGTAAYLYSWSPSAGLSSTTDPNPSANPILPTTYVVTVTDAHNCTSTSSLMVNVFPFQTPAITVNGDSLVSSTGDSYQWILNGNLIAGANYMSYLPAQNGDYSVFVSDNNGCSDTSAIFQYISVGIHRVDGNRAFQIYPNPAGEYFVINVGMSSINKQLIIYDIAGKIVENILIKDINNLIDARNFSRGVYTAILNDGNEIVVSRIVITN